MSDICNRCKRDRSEEGDLLSSAYGWVCEQCANELTKCSNCQELVEEDEIRLRGSDYMCEACNDYLSKQETEDELRTWLQRRQA